MKCAYCGNEMEQGFLQGNQRLAWVKKPRKLSLRPKQGEILLENNAFSSTVFSACICKSCKKIVVDYSDKDIREG